MKSLLLILFTTAFSFTSTCQSFNHLNTCDSTYIFDYRNIYSDFESDLTSLIEDKLSDRYNASIFYWGNGLNESQDMLISVSIPGHYEYELFMLVCKAEELFQTGKLHDYVIKAGMDK